jgi:hypothetical protein
MNTPFVDTIFASALKPRSKAPLMSMRLLACLAGSLAIVLPASLHAQEQDSVLEIKRLQALLSVINTELKSDLDQILMLQEAIKANDRASLEAQGRSPDAVMLEASVAAQRRAIQRETAINARLDAILARSAALDAKKQPLLERVRELGMTPPVTTPKVEDLAK